MPAGSTVLSFLTDKPDVPELPEININKEQKRAIAANLANIPEISRLAKEYAVGGAEAVAAAMEAAVPKYQQFEQEITEQILSDLRGEFSPTEKRLLAQRAAERGIRAGTGGAQVTKFGELDAYQQSQYQRRQQGLNSAMAWLGFVRSGFPQLDMSSMFITPVQRIAIQNQLNKDRWQLQWLKNQLDAMPEPWQQGVAYEIDVQEQRVWSFISSYYGGKMGGGMGGGGGGQTTEQVGQSPALRSPNYPTANFSSVANAPSYASQYGISY